MTKETVPNEEQKAKAKTSNLSKTKITDKINLTKVKKLLAEGKITEAEVSELLSNVSDKEKKQQIKAKIGAKADMQTVKNLLAEGKITQEEVFLLLKDDTDDNSTKNPRKTSDVPKQQRAISALGAKIFINWHTHFDTLQVPDVDRNALNTNVQQLTAAIDAVDTTAASKQVNTVALKTVNKAIDAAVQTLKKQLKLFYTDLQLKSTYVVYGLVADANNVYKLPADNNIRQAKLSLLIQKLQEANNPITTLPNFNLSEWLNLQTEHNQLWLDSENLRQTRSDLGQQVRNLYELVQADIKRVHSYMAFSFNKRDLASRRRLMGFLKESV